MRVCGAPAPGFAQCLSQVVGDRPAPVGPLNLTTNHGAYGPGEFHAAYKLPTKAATHRTVAVVTAFDDPNVLKDLNTWNKRWGLPAFPLCGGSVTTSCLLKVNQAGHTSPRPPVDHGWALETSLDVQTVHGICQNCKILVVEATSNFGGDLVAAEKTAVRMGAAVVSNSWGLPEFSGSNQSVFTAPFDHPYVPITFSSGDDGHGVMFPASLNTVVAVGGTTLRVRTDNTWMSESAWSGAGSGCSKYIKARAPQNTSVVSNWAATGCGSHRAVVDVSADADPATGAWVYDSTPSPYPQSPPGSHWYRVGGTSLSSPIIAGVYGLAGKPSVPYPAARLYTHRSALHDPTGGANGTCALMCHGATGYDGPTGIGSPKGLGAF